MKSHHQSCDSKHHEYAQSNNCSDIDFLGKGNSADIGVSESLVTGARQVRRNARMSSRGFSGSHVVKIGDVHSFEFIRVNRSGVITPRSWSSPRMNLLGSHEEIHGVTSFNRIDIAPSDGEFMERICDDDSFVKESDLGSDKQQECCVTKKKIEEQGADSGLKATVVKVRTGDANTENKDTYCVDEITSWTKNLSVGHSESFSWNSERSAA